MMGSLAGKHVLIVEDEYFVASDLKRALEKEDAVVVGPAGDLDKGLSLAGVSGMLEVAGDSVDIRFPPAIDALDDHEPAAAVAEEAKGVAGRHRVGAARLLRGELLDRLRAEARAKPAERAKMLRTVAAREQVDGSQRLAGHRGQA